MFDLIYIGSSDYITSCVVYPSISREEKVKGLDSSALPPSI